MRVLAVIPARYGSTRLPAKPLADILGKPMIQWVYERTRAAKSIERVVIATDDERIASVVRGFGGEVLLTSPDLQSGTDRVAAVADQIKAEVYVNVQGDEPMMDPRAIDAAVELVTQKGFEIGTVMAPLKSKEELEDPSVVKVLVDHTGRAIYFSRFAIPYSRTPAADGIFVCRKHVGLYTYRRDTLFRFRSLAPSPIEKGEMLDNFAHCTKDWHRRRRDDFTAYVDNAEDLEKVRRA